MLKVKGWNMLKFFGKLPAMLWNMFWHPDTNIVSQGMFPSRTFTKTDYLRIGKVTRTAVIFLQIFYIFFLPFLAVYLISALGQSFEVVSNFGDRVLGTSIAVIVWIVLARTFWPGIRNLPWLIRNWTKASGK